MKKLIALSAIFFAVVLTSNVFAQATSSTASATASAKIMIPIAIAKNIDLSFGNIASSTSTGTVVIAPDASGTRTYTGGVTPSVIGAYTSAKYTVTGEGSSTYTIALPSSITINSGSNSMTVNNFTSNESDGIGTLSSGSQIIYVGATLNVAASQATGTYSGSYDVTVAYN